MTLSPAKAPEAVSTRSDLIAAARVDFGVFAILAFPSLHGGKHMTPAAYVDLIAEVLMATTDGGFQRVIFNLPPGHMKSLLVSIFYSAWRLGVNPNEKIICVSYGDDLAHDLSRKTRQVMQSPIYREIFPGTVLDKKAQDAITTTKGGQRYATAVGSAITGFRADVIILDDLMQPDQVGSELAKQTVREWFSGVVTQRLRDQSTGVIILVMHRLAPDDLTATLVASGGWLHIPLPLIAVTAENFIADDDTLLRREPGDILNEPWMPRKVVDKLKKELPPHIWEAQYQQNPQYGGSGICSIDRLVRYREAPRFELTIHSWDLAATKNGGDWTVCAQFGLAKSSGGVDLLYLIRILRMRIELPDVRAMVIEQDKLERPAMIILDANGVGMGVYQDLANGGMKWLRQSGSLTQSKTDNLKVQRFHHTLRHLYDGLILVPEFMPGLESFLAELAAFPDGKHDDQVDALTVVGAYREIILREARNNADRYARWSPEKRAALEEARQAQPAPQQRSRYFDRYN